MGAFPPASSKEENIMILVIGHVKIAPEKIAAVLPTLRATIATTRQEAGCILYAFGEDVSEPGVLRIVERWESWETLAAHGKAPHMKAWGEFLKANATVLDREVIAYEAGATKAL
jgi:quinol monooxygenase YgiN